MNYSTYLNITLDYDVCESYTVLDLFAGCGGLSLGFESVGFSTLGFERDTFCCDTYNRNLSGKCAEAVLTPQTELPSADVVIGGPPCQPFSEAGNSRGLEDSRDGFPTFISAVERIRPSLWLFENVKGMQHRHSHYFNKILESLSSLGYTIDYRVMNAADFRVPQNRERLIVVGHRGGFLFPTPNGNKVTSGEALQDILYKDDPSSKFLTASMDSYIAKYEKACGMVNPRDLHLDKPARTLTCRNLAGATSDMQRIKFKDGRRRRLLVREAARLQSFPDWFEFYGSESSQYYQIGNAVPPVFARYLAQSVKSYLKLV